MSIKERNGYKNIVDMSDNYQQYSPDDLLMKRVKELEGILNEYRQTFDEQDERKLSSYSANKIIEVKNNVFKF